MPGHAGDDASIVGRSLANDRGDGRLRRRCASSRSRPQGVSPGSRVRAASVPAARRDTAAQAFRRATGGLALRARRLRRRRVAALRAAEGPRPAGSAGARRLRRRGGRGTACRGGQGRALGAAVATPGARHPAAGCLRRSPCGARRPPRTACASRHPDGSCPHSDGSRAQPSCG